MLPLMLRNFLGFLGDSWSEGEASDKGKREGSALALPKSQDTFRFKKDSRLGRAGSLSVLSFDFSLFSLHRVLLETKVLPVLLVLLAQE